MLNRFFTSSYSVLILPFLWLGIRYGIGWGSQFDAAIGTQWGVLSHLLLVLLAILFAMNQAHQRREYGFGYFLGFEINIRAEASEEKKPKLIYIIEISKNEKFDLVIKFFFSNLFIFKKNARREILIIIIMIDELIRKIGD
jgi:hypothetical protein